MAIQEMLIGYRSSPHPATGVTPYEALMKRQVRTKLDYQTTEDNVNNIHDTIINRRDAEYKDKIKVNAQNKNTKEHNFIKGDHVLLKRRKTNQWSTAFEPAFYIVTRVDGSSIVARRITDGRNVYRDSSQFKLANALIGDDSDQEIRGQGTELNHADCRQGILMNAGSHAAAAETTSRPELKAEKANSNPEPSKVPGTGAWS